MVSLSKGGKANITKGGIKNIKVGLSWDANEFGGNPFDLDASIFMLKPNPNSATVEKHSLVCPNPNTDFIFYGNLKHPSGAVVHSGDERTGAAAGDDETIGIDFTKMPAEITELHIIITIANADDLHQNFGMVQNSMCKVYGPDGAELIKYELGEDMSTETAVLIGRMYLKDGEWKFDAVGSGFPGGLKAFCDKYEVPVE